MTLVAGVTLPVGAQSAPPLNMAELKGLSPKQLTAMLTLGVMGDMKPQEIKMIVAAGADLNLGDEVQGNTPLHAAAMGFSKDKVKLLAFLIKAGARADVQNKKGQSPLHVLCSHSSALGQLDGTEEFLAAVKGLAKHMKQLNLKNNSGQTPLHLACEQGSLPTVQALLEAGADANSTDAAGRTPLFSAILTPRKASKNVVELLIEKGARLDATDTSGDTPAAFARKNHRADLVGLLAAQGAPDPSAGEDQCRRNRSLLTGSLEMYNMDSPKMVETITGEEWAQWEKTLIEKRYLKTPVACPDGGTYSCTEGRVSCSKHGQ